MEPRKKKILSKYYLLVFPPFILSFIILKLVGVEVWNLILFTLGFSWQVVLKAPHMKDRLNKKSHRFSFIRFIYLCDEFFLKLIGENPHPLKVMFLRAFSPFLFGSALVICIGYGSLLFLIGGIALSELLLFKRNSIAH